MIGLVLGWSHALAALAFALLAGWQLRRWREDRIGRPLVVAFAVTAAWAAATALLGPQHALAALLESARNFAFLFFMYAIVRSASAGRQRGLVAVYAAVAGVIGLQIALAGVLPRFAATSPVHGALIATLQLISLLIAAGSLILVHNLYGQAAPRSRWGIRLPALALAGMWAYDLHLYTVAHLAGGDAGGLFALRGAVLALLVPLFTLAARRNARWKVELSRAATFQTLSLGAILAYLFLMLFSRQLLALAGGSWAMLGQVAFVFAITVVAALLIASGTARAWLRVNIAKHFFEHRYDYRTEWLGFTSAIARGDAPLPERIVKAMAELAGSGAGLLLTADGGRIAPAAQWNWAASTPPETDAAALIAEIEESGRILDFEQGVRHAALPAWIVSAAPWAGIPLLHDRRLVGLVLLAHPPVRRPLDWEDFDLFRTAGTQAASYLAEARGQATLADAQRFDEFNRRFAFIMHDIKNLVSQLALVARNAERHAANPEFRADMIATLQSSVRKMNELLARLAREAPAGDAEGVQPIDAGSLAARIASVKARLHPISVGGHGLALADPARLEQAITHLLQNAIEASPDGDPVELSVRVAGEAVSIDVIDRGIGMSPEFVRTQLFQPFASTKAGGFGIGAYEARALVQAMNGRLEVESREGEGTRFRIVLPAAADRRLVERVAA